MTLTEYLFARQAEDEAEAELDYEELDDLYRVKLSEGDQAARRAQCAYRRRLLELHREDREHVCPTEDGGSEHFGHLFGWAEEIDYPQRCPTLRLLAMEFISRTDFRREWFPDAPIG